MKFFLDSAKIDEVKYAYEYLGFDGVTTNPRHIQNSGKPFLSVLDEFAEWAVKAGIEGAETFPISVELNPHLEHHEKMVEAGGRIAAMSKNFVIKIACTEEGIIASRILESRGIPTNVTLVFSPSQALLPAKNKAMFVSPFVGWKESSGEESFAYVERIVRIFRTYSFRTQVIAAALRTGKQIAEAAAIGAHITTCGLSVYQESLRHPFTDYGIGVFTDAWDKTETERV